MKPKALKKRLVLNKKTIVNLSETAMGEVQGGINIDPNHTYGLTVCPYTAPLPVCLYTLPLGCDTEMVTVCLICYPDKEYYD